MSDRKPKIATCETPHPAERIAEGTGDGRVLDRFRVPGGWLYRAVEYDMDTWADPNVPTPYGVALCFVPDPPGA